MVHSPLPPSGLLGRHAEREALEELVAGITAGQSRVLVLRGEAGVGKTALLEHLVRHANGCRVARAAGVESESELPFAGLHALCAPFLERLPALPEPQHAALAIAFGLDAGPVPDRFMVGLAVLSLLADAAETEPLLCVVDDAQWLDGTSAHALAFVGRRLLAERIGLVFAQRDPADDRLAGLPELTIAGIGERHARMLLDATIPGPLDDRVRTRILAEAGGNPLALLELPRGLTRTSVAGGFGLPDPMPLAGRIEQEFLRQLEPLPDLTRRLLLLAAAEPVGDAGLLRRAATPLGIPMAEAAAPAEAAALIEIGARVRFRHPLVRSAVYRSAAVPDRRAAHRALAEATDPDADPDRRAWHRAHAAAGPDEAVAEALDRSAGRAQARGGVAAQAAFLTRATELTPDPARRGGRALAAAQATFESAAPEAALELLAVAELCPLDDLQRARLARLRGEIVFALRRGKDAPPLLLHAARALEPLDPAAAREVHLEALGAAMYAGRLAGGGEVRAAAAAARAAPRPDPATPPRSIDLVLDGMAERFADGPGAGVPALRTALRAYQDEALDTHADAMRWLLLAPVVQSLVVFELWDDEAFAAIATRAVRLARDAGALAMLPVTLVYLSGVHLFGGELTTAAAMLQEAETITSATGNAGLVYGQMLLDAQRGDEAAASALIDSATASATARGEGRVLALAGYASAVLHNGLGRYDIALEAARRGSDDPDQGYAAPALAELVEAASRAGRPELAATALPLLERRAQAAGTGWALGIAARARALATADPAAADASYREAIAHLEPTRMRIELARARLVYGEWLRRENRRVDARAQLRAAHDTLSRVGAEAFAQRARRELSATGETLTRRDAAPEARDALTPQEEQIARLAREGHSNPEIGAQLFISPRTVEYHLRKVFTKLGISSRREL
jgi:DNA-binding CsgD family transcriptional regulator